MSTVVMALVVKAWGQWSNNAVFLFNQVLKTVSHLWRNWTSSTLTYPWTSRFDNFRTSKMHSKRETRLWIPLLLMLPICYVLLIHQRSSKVYYLLFLLNMLYYNNCLVSSITYHDLLTLSILYSIINLLLECFKCVLF